LCEGGEEGVGDLHEKAPLSHRGELGFRHSPPPPLPCALLEGKPGLNTSGDFCSDRTARGT